MPTQIATISSDTSATVAVAPTTAYSSSTLTKKSYTNLALHEYAIALALRPIATPDEARNVVNVSYIDLQGIPLHHGQLRPHLPGPIRHGQLRLRPGRHPARLRRHHQLLRKKVALDPLGNNSEPSGTGRDSAGTRRHEPAQRGGSHGPNGKWVLNPGEAYQITPLGTAVATATSKLLVDWSLGGYFQVTAYGGGWTITFTNAAGVLTPMIGQKVLINITKASSSAITWPTTITWFTASSAAPTTTTNNAIVALVCTGLGTYDGWIMAQVS